jgi:amidase
MARRVGDLRAALDVLAGTDPRDPWSVEVPVAGPPIRRPIRVAVVADPGGGGVARQVRAGVVRAAEALADSGYVCEDVEPLGIEDAARALLDMLTTPEIRAAWAPLAAIVPPDTQRFMEAFFAVAGDADPIRPMRGFVTRLSLGRSWSAFQETWPLILAPIGTEPPFEAWADLGDGRVAETIHDMRMAMAVNALGLPAVAVPVGIGAGLPQVVQVIGPRHREDLCLDAGEAIEARLGVVTPIDPLPRGVRES